MNIILVVLLVVLGIIVIPVITIAYIAYKSVIEELTNLGGPVIRLSEED